MDEARTTTNPKKTLSTRVFIAVLGLALATVAAAGVAHLVETAFDGIVSQHRIDLAALVVLVLLLALMSMFPKMLAEHRDQIQRETLKNIEAAEVDGKYFYLRRDDHAKLCRELIQKVLDHSGRNVKAVLSCRWGEDIELKLSLTAHLIAAAHRLSDDLVVILHGSLSPGDITAAPLSLAEKIAAVSPDSTLQSGDSIGPDFVLIDDTHLFLLTSSSKTTSGKLNLEGVLYIEEASRKELNDKRITGVLAKQFEQLVRTATPYERRPTDEAGRHYQDA